MIQKVNKKGYSNHNRYDLGYKRQGMPIYKNNRTSFTGKIPQIPTTSLKDAIEYVLPRPTKVLKKLGSNGGEIQNIIINACGTGLVAPIFIKYNFLSDADQDTRTYSAWRQPVSAVLAIATQAGFTAPFYKIFENWSNDGSFGEKLNKTPFQEDYYLTKIIKKQNPNATKKQISDLVKTQKENQRKLLLQTLEEENTVYFSRDDGTKVKINEEAYRNILNETIDKLAASDRKSLDNLEKTIAKRTARSKFYRANNQEVANILSELHTNISGASNLKEINAFLSGKISDLKGNKNLGEMKSILEEIRSRAKVISIGKDAIAFNDIQQALIEKVEKMQEHVKKYKGIATEQEVEQIVQDIVAEEKTRLQSALDFYKTLKTSITNNSNIGELKKAIEAKCKELGIKDSGLNKNFVEEVANQLVSRVKTNMKWFKQFIGVFVSLGMLPITCTLLNWIYPRFMDIFFPNLSSKKHNNESAKLVSAAPKATGIKSTETINSASKVSMSGIDSFKKKAEVA